MNFPCLLLVSSRHEHVHRVNPFQYKFEFELNSHFLYNQERRFHRMRPIIQKHVQKLLFHRPFYNIQESNQKDEMISF